MVSAGRVGDTRGSGIVYSATDVLCMSVVRGMRGDVYGFGPGGVGEEGMCG